MRYAIVFALILIALPAHSAEYQARYLSNYDADTLRLEINGRNEAVRLADVDAPEIKGKCPAEKELAIRAREFTRTWAMRSDLTLTTGKREREKYGRLLGILTNQDGESLGDKLIEAGLAVRWEGHRHRGWCE
jgi:micrococcal nuclease